MLKEFLITFGWGITGAVTMGFSLILVFYIFSFITRGLDEMKELKKGNIAVGIMVGALMLATGIVIAACVLPNLAEVVSVTGVGK